MATAWIEDRWRDKDGQPTARDGVGSRWQVVWWADEPGPRGEGRKQRRKKSHRRKTDAQTLVDELNSTTRSGTYINPDAGSLTFHALWTEWISTRADIKGSTLARYHRDARSYVLPQWGHRRVSTITRAEISTWVAALAAGTAPAAYKIRGTTETTLATQTAPLSANSIKHLTTITSAVLEWAVETRRIPTNPAHRVKRPRAEQTEQVYLNHREVEALATAAEGATGSASDRALVLFLAYTGVRIGEATALRVGDVDLTTRRAQIRQTWTVDAGGKRTLGTPKNHERRAVPLTSAVRDAISPLLTDQSPDAYVFRAPRGGALNDHNWRTRVFNVAAHDADLQGRGLTPHKLRHTAAAAAIAAGADVQVVRTMLGHRDASMTLDVYGHLWPDRLDEVADAMDSARTLALTRKEVQSHGPQMAPMTSNAGQQEGRLSALSLVTGLPRSG